MNQPKGGTTTDTLNDFDQVRAAGPPFSYITSPPSLNAHSKLEPNFLHLQYSAGYITIGGRGLFGVLVLPALLLTLPMGTRDHRWEKVWLKSEVASAVGDLALFFQPGKL